MSVSSVSSSPNTNTNPNVMATNTAHRITPTDGPTFGEVMRGSANQMIRGASAAVRVLPSGPIIAASVRPGAVGYSGATGMSPMGGSVPGHTAGGMVGVGVSGVGVSGVAIGGGGVGLNVGGSAGSAEGVGGTAGGGAGGEDAVEAAMSRSQDMNLYLIDLQERVATQNRVFTTYSNVLKAKHDTVKNAINNIR